MRTILPIASHLPLLIVAAAALAAPTLGGCVQLEPGRGAHFADVADLPGTSSEPTAPDGTGGGTTTKRGGTTSYRGYCERHGALTGLSTDEAGVDRVIKTHNALYHGAGRNQMWIGEKISVVDGW
jgi:hypothetical protein